MKYSVYDFENFLSRVSKAFSTLNLLLILFWNILFHFLFKEVGMGGWYTSQREISIRC